MLEEKYPFGYSTNVHAGTSLDDAKANLLTYASPVRQLVCHNAALPVGLWLAENAALRLIEENHVQKFGEWLSEHHFSPYTFNGFPQGDFHQPVVKHAVYEPTWTCDSRVRYTLCLAEILDALLPAGGVGSISTLPLGWPHAPWHAENYKNAADNLLEVAKFLDRQFSNSGNEVVLAIEPEPGCVLNTATDVVEFFEHYLFSGPDAQLARRYLTVCHDVCHSGVMFEPQVDALELYRNAGIRVGKVQISSAVHVPWDTCVGDSTTQAAMLQQLQAFSEPKYLHQTSRQNSAGGLDRLIDDLPLALRNWLPDDEFPSLPWRVHFHVPVFVDEFEYLRTTQADIIQATRFLEEHKTDAMDGYSWFTGHYEVETYAWPVLPAELAGDGLVEGIARELQYFQAVLEACKQT
jgi:hypothetical protein